MNGLEATKEIRRREKERRRREGEGRGREEERRGREEEMMMKTKEGVVIIGLSGNARDVYSEMGQSVGMDDYVVSKNRERERYIYI